MKNIVPNDSRYVPLTQQKSCCVPTCIQIVMLRNNIPLLPAEEIGYHLGLVVHPDRANLFYNVRTSKEKPAAGYGTRIYDPRFTPNMAFENLNLPMSLQVKPISTFPTTKEIKDYLSNSEKQNKDILLCFNHGALTDEPDKDWGHVCVFDRLIGNNVRFIDPSPDEPKWKTVSVEKLYYAMKQHGEKRSGGVWETSIRR